jgi:hypothetical protein
MPHSTKYLQVGAGNRSSGGKMVRACCTTLATDLYLPMYSVLTPVLGEAWRAALKRTTDDAERGAQPQGGPIFGTYCMLTTSRTPDLR